MESMELDINGIHEYQQNRYPYLLIDHATEIIPGVSAKGYKNLTINDRFFKCHFPGDPNMPGMLQMEAIIQLSALMVLTLPGNKGKVVYVVSGNNMKWRRKVLVGERFDIDTKVLTWARGLGKCAGVGTVNGEVACRTEFNIVMPEILEDFKVVK